MQENYSRKKNDEELFLATTFDGTFQDQIVETLNKVQDIFKVQALVRGLSFFF